MTTRGSSSSAVFQPWVRNPTRGRQESERGRLAIGKKKLLIEKYF